MSKLFINSQRCICHVALFTKCKIVLYKFVYNLENDMLLILEKIIFDFIVYQVQIQNYHTFKSDYIQFITIMTMSK